MFHRIVRRVPVRTDDPASDLSGLIDMIEIELDISTGGRSVRERLSEDDDEMRHSEGVAKQESVIILLEAVERLQRIERHLSESSFNTKSRQSPD
jgi:hypothetical protein